MNIRYILNRLTPSTDEKENSVPAKAASNEVGNSSTIMSLTSYTRFKSSDETKISFGSIKTTWRDTLLKIRPIIETTLIGTGARWITWPLEISFYQASIAKKPFSYFSIYGKNLKWSALPELNKSFIKTGLIQTLLKSSCGPPVLIYVDQYHSGLNTNQKIVFSTILSSILETIFTSRGEYFKVRDILKKQNLDMIPHQANSVFSQPFGRVLAATFVRLVWSGFFTIGAFCKTTEFLETQFPKEAADHPTLVKPVASIIGTFASQWIIKPSVKYQTLVLANPNKPIWETTKEFFISANKMQGAWGRAGQRALMYSLTWFFSEKLKQYHEQDAQENKSSEHKISLRK